MTCTTLMSRHWGQRIIWSKDMLPGWGLILVTDSRSVLGLELQTSLLGFMNLNCGGCWEALGIVVLPPKSSWRSSKHVKASKTCQTHEIVQISNMFCPSCWFDIFPTSRDLVFSCPSTITCSLQQRQAGAWQPVTADNVPAARHGHTAVLDAKQRMWVFGGSNGAPEVKAARCGAHISMGYRVSEHPNRGYSFSLDIPYIYHDPNLGIILALYHIPMGYTIHIPFSCSTGVQGFNPDSYDEGMEKTPRNKPQLCPKVTWSTVHEWPVLLGCWGRKVGEPCQLADPSGPPKTRWNGYFLWWYPKSQLVSLLNPTILGYEGYPTMEIPPNPSPKSWVYDHCWMVWLPSGQGLAASDCWQCPSCATQPQRGPRRAADVGFWRSCWSGPQKPTQLMASPTVGGDRWGFLTDLNDLHYFHVEARFLGR